MEKKQNLEEFEVADILSHIDEILKASIEKQRIWVKIMEYDFSETTINQEFKVDMRFDNHFIYQCSNHEPCVYFRVGEGKYDFLPMIISDTPYVPYSFEQTISDEDLYWVSFFVETNKTLLLEYANGKYGYGEFMSLVDRCDNIPE